MKKVLHISNWYPNKWNDLEGIFVKEQFDVFSKVTKSTMLNVQVREGEKLLSYKYIQYSDNEEGYYLFSKIKSQKIIEILTTFLVLYALYKSRYKNYEVLHFHIAYPLLTYYSWWKKIIKIPILISEHWSAYHFNFYMPRETNKLNRIKDIFKQKIPLITVSGALLKDIQKFSNADNFPAYVIPNVIDTKVYKQQDLHSKNNIPQFFIVNLWRSIKKPYPMLEAFTRLFDEGIDFQLKIGGYGPILEEMKDFVRKRGLDDHVIFLGKMYKNEIAKEMNCADAYLFSSEYETFSVVCAEALSCGCPLIGPHIPAIREYTEKDNITLLKSNNVEGWEIALKIFLKTKENFNHAKIAQKAESFLSHEKIKEQYISIIDKVNND